jgi:hypothetical protein
VAPVGTVLDLTEDTHPILLERIVPLNDGLKLEASCRIADLFSSQDVHAPLDVLLDDRRRDPFDAHEVLLVKCA